MTYGMKFFFESAIHSFKNQTYFLMSNQVFFKKNCHKTAGASGPCCCLQSQSRVATTKSTPQLVGTLPTSVRALVKRWFLTLCDFLL
jgi:hypothetical protein